MTEGLAGGAWVGRGHHVSYCSHELLPGSQRGTGMTEENREVSRAEGFVRKMGCNLVGSGGHLGGGGHAAQIFLYKEHYGCSTEISPQDREAG